MPKFKVGDEVLIYNKIKETITQVIDKNNSYRVSSGRIYHENSITLSTLDGGTYTLPTKPRDF